MILKNTPKKHYCVDVVYSKAGLWQGRNIKRYKSRAGVSHQKQTHLVRGLPNSVHCPLVTLGQLVRDQWESPRIWCCSGLPGSLGSLTLLVPKGLYIDSQETLWCWVSNEGPLQVGHALWPLNNLSNPWSEFLSPGTQIQCYLLGGALVGHPIPSPSPEFFPFFPPVYLPMNLNVFLCPLLWVQAFGIPHTKIFLRMGHTLWYVFPSSWVCTECPETAIFMDQLRGKSNKFIGSYIYWSAGLFSDFLYT